MFRLNYLVPEQILFVGGPWRATADLVRGRVIPHQKLLENRILTPVPLFCLICTIISNKTGIFD